MLGGNGAGKSTLLRLLAGDEIGPTGRDRARTAPAGRRCGSARSAAQRRPSGIGSPAGDPHLRHHGEELVFSGIDNSVGVYREPSEKELAQVTDILASLHLEFLAKRTIRSCSTGEFRRLPLPEPFAGEPDLLLLDELFSGLDALSRNEFFALLNQACAAGRADDPRHPS